MSLDRWRRRASVSAADSPDHPSPVSTPPHHIESAAGKKPHALTKALRSISGSSVDSKPGNSSSHRRLHKKHSSSGSMMGRLHRRVSRESSSTASLVEYCPAPLLDTARSSMSIMKSASLKHDSSSRKNRSHYLVLTDQCLSRFASFEAARATYPQITSLDDTSIARSLSSASISSKASVGAESLLDIPLRAVVAVFIDATVTSAYTLDLWWSSPPPRIAYCRIQLSFGTADERDEWLVVLHRTCRHKLRQSQELAIVPGNVRTRIQRIVRSTEALADNVPCHATIFPVVRRIGASPKSAADDSGSSPDGATSFYLVIGPFMCYLVEILPSDYNTPPSDLMVKVLSFGTVTLTRFQASVIAHQQTFVMSFRLPFDKETRLTIASIHYSRILETVMKTDRSLRPTWPQHLQQATFDIRGLSPPLQLTSGNDYGGFDISLPAYCAAYQVPIPNWRIDWITPSQPCFSLLPCQPEPYAPLQLLAVFRALRYNSFFKAVSFANVDLSPLAGIYDFSQYGDSVVYTSANRVRMPDDLYEIMSHASVLEQEIHSLLFASDSIRSINLSNVLGLYDHKMRLRYPLPATPDAEKKTSELLRPIMELLKRQLSHCHSISLSRNPISAEDADELRYILSLQHVRLRRLELCDCAIADFGLSDIWAALCNQADTLETINLCNNQGTVRFEIICNALSRFRNITKLYIARNVRLATELSLFDDVALSSWQLQELDLSSLMLNDATVESLATYLSKDSSQSLRLARLNYCGLNGLQMAKLFRSMGADRDMEVYMNSNRIDDGIADLCEVISQGLGPRCLFLQMIDFAREESYVRLLRALTVNTSIKCLSLAGSSTPDTASETACQAVHEFLAKNKTIRYLDMSGYDSRIDEGRLGQGFARALGGLGHNTSIEHLRVRSQMLNINVGDFAEALAVNRTLRTVDCESNDLTLSNLRYLITNLEGNTTLRTFSALSSQELDRAANKTIRNAALPAPAKRPSIISRLRHDKNSPSQQDTTLLEELKGEWEQAAHHLQSIMDRNLRNHFQAMSSDKASASVMQRFSFYDGDNAFAAAFGGLALEDYDGLKKITASVHTQTSSSRSTGGGPGSVHSEVAASPRSEAGNSDLGAASALDLNHAEIGTAFLEEKEQLKIFGDPSDSHETCGGKQDADAGLQMKRYPRYQGDPTKRIEEEDQAHESGKIFV